MSILTSNGKVFTLSGSVLNYTPPPLIYGIDFTNMATTSKCIRTDDAVDFADPNPAVAGGTGSSPFDNTMPWSGMVRSTDPNAGEVVAIPKFYFKWETDGTKATGLKISMAKFLSKDGKFYMRDGKLLGYTPPAPPSTLAANSSWYKGSTNKSTITAIEIKDSYTPTGTVTEQWNADVNNSGSIKAYVEGTKLIIAGNGAGKIFANADSRNVFINFSAVTSISGLNLLDTSNVTNMSNIFYSCIRLQFVTLGKDFKFVGTDGYLPVPSSKYITGATGKWYAPNGTDYTPKELAAITHTLATTYSVAPPGEII